MISKEESNCSKEILNHIYDLRDYFDYSEIEHYKLFSLIIYNNYKDQENTLLEYETDNVLAQIVAKMIANDQLVTYPSKKEEYYKHLTENFDINNIEDYKLLLYFYINYKNTQPIYEVFESIVNKINALIEQTSNIETEEIINDLYAEGTKHCAHCGIYQWQGKLIKLMLYRDKNSGKIIELCPNCYSLTE